MDSMTKPEADRIYEDFEPYHEWDKYDGCFTVVLPGYRRDQMKVQVTSKPALRLMGERPTFQNRWRRFKLEFPIPSDYDTDSVTASFEGGKLSVKFAKLIKPNETTTTTTNPPEETPRPNEPSQKGDEKKGAQEGIPKTKEEKTETKETTTNPPEEAPSPKEPLQKVDEQRAAQEGVSKAKEEKTETKTSVSDENTPPQKEKESITKTTDAETSKSPETKGAKSISRTKTRLVDFTLCKALSNRDENEALGDSTAGLNKWQKLAAWAILILLVVGLGYYCRNTPGSSEIELDTEDLLLDPY
ncbi:hypothetical protein TSUD_250720 [Trifolium subterraneum]|nr:hypothetical protein TSUD_250720 [Trifolium subterraneum]